MKSALYGYMLNVYIIPTSFTVNRIGLGTNCQVWWL